MDYFPFRYSFVVIVVVLLFIGGYFLSISISHSIIHDCIETHNINGTVITCIDHTDKREPISMGKYVAIAIIFPISSMLVVCTISFLFIIFIIRLENNIYDYEIEEIQ